LKQVDLASTVARRGIIEKKVTKEEICRFLEALFAFEGKK
jgi:hypothetical protein